MFTTLRVVTPPASEPIDVSVLRAHLRVDSTNDDALLAIYLAAARQLAEKFLGRALMTQTLLMTVSQGIRLQDEGIGYDWPNISGFPDGYFRWSSRAIELARAPVQSVSSVQLKDCTGTVTAIPSADYFLTTDLDPARLKLDWQLIDQISGITFPIEQIQIEFIAGYDSADDIPATVIAAILLTASALYEHRGDQGVDLPKAAQDLLWQDRIVFFGQD